METKPFIDFQGKRVVVTGASSGIGRAICMELSEYGAGLILMGRDEEGLSETRGLLKGNEHHAILLDLKDYSAIIPRIQEFARDFGRIYGMCHSAGVDETRPLGSYKIDLIYSMLDINLVSGIELAKAVCRRDVIDETGGSILFISSVAALVGVPGRVGYSASKGAVAAAVRSMAIELARRKIRVNSIAPGLVKTGMTQRVHSKLSDQQIRDIENAHPLGIGQAQDIARAAVFLLAPQNSWITGSDMVVDGGYTAQ
jgi:NAD(P)-dependent dehydrogenase (short-subunit alcohol dehydrogenase family)